MNSAKTNSKENFYFCKEIIEELIVGIYYNLEDYSRLSKIPNATETSSANGFEKAIERGLKEIDIISKFKIKHFRENSRCKDTEVELSKKTYLYQVRINQQHIWNQCGYHMAYTLLFFTRFFKTGSLRSINNLISKTSFWQFKTNIRDFINNYALKHNYNQSKYPWDYKTIDQGDYERIFHATLTKHHPLYIETFKSTPYCYVRTDYIEMQFGRYITDFPQLTKLQYKITQFINYKSQWPKVFNLQLAITNHWVGFSCVFYQDKKLFFYFDSNNDDILGKSSEFIEKFVKKRSEERKNRYKFGPRVWNDFKMLCHIKSREDIQIITRVLPQVFLGAESLFNHPFRYFFLQNYKTDWKPLIINPLEIILNNPTEAKNHLLKNLGELKTFVYQLKKYVKVADMLKSDNKRELVKIWKNDYDILIKGLKYIQRYIRGREMLKNLKKAREYFLMGNLNL